MNRLPLLLLSVCLVSRIGAAATCRNDFDSKRAVSAADEASYRDVRDGRFWRNPEIFVEEKGIYVRFPENKLERRNLTIDQTLLLLNQQDCRVWPYGAVVMLSEASIQSPLADHAAIRKILLDLKQALEKDGIRADLWPSG
jgi:hypothetical protein